MFFPIESKPNVHHILLEVPSDAPEEAIWAEEPAATIISYEAEQEAFDVPIDMPGIETMGPGVGW